MGSSHLADWKTEADCERMLPQKCSRPSERLFPWSSFSTREISSRSINESESWVIKWLTQGYSGQNGPQQYFLHPWTLLGISNTDPTLDLWLLDHGSFASASSATTTCHQQEPRRAASHQGLTPRAAGLIGQRLGELSTLEKKQGCLGPSLSLVILNGGWVS